MTGEADILLFEDNSSVRKRIERVLSAGAGLTPVWASGQATDAGWVGRPRLIACGLQQLSGIERLIEDLPSTNVLIWGTRNSKTLCRWAEVDGRFGHFVAWPEFASMPKAVDLLVTARRLLHPSRLAQVSDLMAAGAATKTFRPGSSHDLEDVVASVRGLARAAGLNDRQAERAAVVAHELVMNAMYGAPVAPDGVPKYAHDRKTALELPPDEVPTLTLATDGVRLGIQVSDPFGRLERGHVFGGITRGLAAMDAASSLDTRRGGAGLGIFRIFDAAHALFFDVRPGRQTDAVALFELDVSPREQRTMPTTVCYFDG